MTQIGTDFNSINIYRIIDSKGNSSWAFIDGSIKVTETKNGISSKVEYRFTAIKIKKAGGRKWSLFDSKDSEQ